MARTRRHARKNRGSRKGKSATRHYKRHHRRGRKTRTGGFGNHNTIGIPTKLADRSS